MDSMTGYGRGAARRDGREITVEFKAVNHRFLDLSFRAPKNLAFLEDAFRSFLNESGVRRGHVDIFINYANHREDAQKIVLDRELLHSFRKAWHECEDLLDFCKKPDAAEVLTMSGAYSLRQADEDAEAVTALALEAAVRPSKPFCACAAPRAKRWPGICFPIWTRFPLFATRSPSVLPRCRRTTANACRPVWPSGR